MTGINRAIGIGPGNTGGGMCSSRAVCLAFNRFMAGSLVVCVFKFMLTPSNASIANEVQWNCREYLICII